MNKRYILSTCTEAVNRVPSIVADIEKRVTLSQDVKDNVMISLTEAISNAICHGNHSNPDKKVYVGLSTEDDQLEITVHDEGVGFDYENTSDPLAKENICKCGGRGLHIMKTLCDEIHFKGNGNIVVMKFAYRSVQAL